MANINWVKDRGTVSLTYTYRAGSAITTGGGAAQIKDENDSTSWWVNAYYDPPPGGRVYTTCEVTFDLPASLNRVRSVIMSWEDGTAAPIHSRILSYYNGSWINLVSGNVTRNTVITNDYSGLSLTNVTKVKIYVESGSAMNNAKALTYELSAWGPPPYSDIGLRIRTSSGTIKIGVEDLDGHKLRIRKGGTTYGIPLLATNDSDASGLRIYDGSAVKALPKVD